MEVRTEDRGEPQLVLAAERTMLAWARTGLSMMGFGFVVARFGLFLREMAAHSGDLRTGTFSRWMGVSLVLMGVMVNGFAAVQHVMLLGDRKLVDRRRRVSGWIGVVMTVLLAVAGLGMAGYLVVVR